MLIILIKILLISGFVFIFYQDIKERQVYLFLFPLVALVGGYLFFKATLYELFIMSILMNMIFVSILILTLVIYIKLKMKTNVSDAIGSGDLLLLFFLCFLFSTVSFSIVLIGSLVFSLTLHLALKKKSAHGNVPLAGYMSLFFAITFLAFWTGLIDSLYSI